jgi:hypothetical protein
MVIMVLGRGVRVTGVMVDGVIMVIGVRVTEVMVEGAIMVIGVRVTGVMVGIADNTPFRPTALYNAGIIALPQ